MFEKGQLVQVYWSNLDYTFKAERKMVSRWSQPFRIRERVVNSYTLDTKKWQVIEGEFHTR